MFTLIRETFAFVSLCAFSATALAWMDMIGGVV